MLFKIKMEDLFVLCSDIHDALNIYIYIKAHKNIQE